LHGGELQTPWQVFPHDLLIRPESISSDLDAANDALRNVGNKRLGVLRVPFASVIQGGKCVCL
jgi:hypothetical protein